MKQQDICFLLGNGQSRLGLDLDYLKERTIVWGTNALYRDWTPDRFVSVDIEMSHEIYRSGYCKENITYFREWCRLPAEAYELVVIPSHITNVGASKFDDSADYSSYIHESPRLDGYDEFVMSGQSLDRTVRIREEYLAQHPDARPEDVDIVLGLSLIHI